ncbi:hypothetical protein TNCV_482951 [Trichonephila clavipes]|uniref:Uncharacterized protein n=1 Tax=Trichonephila clavipes TaxID=2585209 RepID=A0A8X6RFH0_TRICX|nr:hypothetical protein TNCV_482951 [Trichonephila clavipes]
MRSTTSVHRTLLHPTVTYPHCSCLVSSNTTTDLPENNPQSLSLVDRRPSTTLASPQPVIIQELQPPVQIPPVSPVQIPDPPVQISDTPVQIPDLPVQIPVTLELATPQPPAQILLPDPTEPPAQILDPPVQISMTPEPTTLQQPVQIPNPPVQITVTPQLTTPQTPLQILLTHPPVLETLEPTITDDFSIDQIT